MHPGDTQNSKTIKGNKQSRRHHYLRFQVILQGNFYLNSIVLAQKQTWQLLKNRKYRDNPRHIHQSYFSQKSQKHTLEQIWPLTNDAEKAGYAHAEDCNYTHKFHPALK